MAEIVTRYFRVKVEGLRHVPRKGPVIVVANHSGYAGADAIVLAHLLHSRVGRSPRILAHPFFFMSRLIRIFFRGFGLREAKYRSGLRSLREGNVLLIFPEGERGNFKSTLKRYRLQPFHTGFIRMALATHAKVVPCLVTGAEESHWNLGSLSFGRFAPKLRIPFPVNLFPLPARWRIRFLPARDLELPRRPRIPHRQKLRLLSSEMREEMQFELADLLRDRKYVFFTS
jgi:1-acyl-sn-glycerol-3-phosphate acyltransferase